MLEDEVNKTNTWIGFFSINLVTDIFEGPHGTVVIIPCGTVLNSIKRMLYKN